MKYKISLSINKNKKQIKVLSHTNNYIKTKNNFIAVLGNIYDLDNNKLSIDDIQNIYNKYKENINNYIDGIYSLIIYDSKEEKLYVFQDYFGSNHQIYYFDNTNDIYISNELKEIIINNNITWELDKKSVNYFLNDGYILNGKTLVKNIHKLSSKRYLEIDLSKNKIKQKRIKNPIFKKDIVVDKAIYTEEVSKIIKGIVKDSKTIATTISSGYDTNFLLFLLNKEYKKQINSYCIGGKIGRNEIDASKKICSYYDNVKFNSEYVDGDTLNNYPEIVWILEGSIFEKGIFLQYELTKLINKNKNDNIILGECADQVLRYELYHEHYLRYRIIKNRVASFIKKLMNKPTYKKTSANPYEFASYLLIKKSGLMMNYFDINPNYIYTRKSFRRIASLITNKKDLKKTYHKNVIKQVLPKKITETLNKYGGTTELKTLYTGNIKEKEIKDFCMNSEFYINKKFKNKEDETEYNIKILYIELFKKMFLTKDIKKYNSKIEDYKLEYFLNE